MSDLEGVEREGGDRRGYKGSFLGRQDGNVLYLRWWLYDHCQNSNSTTDTCFFLLDVNYTLINNEYSDFLIHVFIHDCLCKNDLVSTQTKIYYTHMRN